MGIIHEQLGQLGRQGALAFADSARDRKTLEVAHEFMSDENGGIGYIFSGWCQTALPHRRLADDEVWAVRTDYVKLMVEPGSIDKDDQIIKVGVPYGSRARLILLFLQGEAIRSKSPEIELGKSLRVWLGKLGVPIGGRSLKEVREQSLRLSRCRMSFQITHGDRTGFINQNIVDTAMFSSEANGSLLETVCLSDRFFRELQKHPVPLQDAAIRSLSNNSQALDIYCWLAYRLHSLGRATEITWGSLVPQFGGGETDKKAFRRRFQENLRLAMAVYPEAKVEVIEGGLRLSNSKPAVPIRG
jgi:hypothetical protein